MKITFPHMGNLCILGKVFFEDLNIDYIMPPMSNKKALEIGTKYAPEGACMPLKINLGNYIQGIEKGADTLIMLGGCGPCRFGYYCEVLKEILKDLEYDVECIVLEPPNNGNISIMEFLRRGKRIVGNQSIWNLIKAGINILKVSIELDKMEKLSFKVRPREKEKGKTDWIMKKFYHKLSKIKGSSSVLKLIDEIKIELEQIEIDEFIQPLKIGIVGEIYTVLEPFINIEIIQILGNMGVHVDRSLNISEWIIEHIIKEGLHLKKDNTYARAAKPYLKTMIGGHAQHTIGNTVLYARNGFDGVIQLLPFSCMPEIVAESILPTVSKQENIPILTLITDEMTGEGGYKTRIEAFIDMIARRKEGSMKHSENLLSWN